MVQMGLPASGISENNHRIVCMTALQSIHNVKLSIILGKTPYWTSGKSFNKRLETAAVIEIVGSTHSTPPRQLRKSDE